MRFLRKEPFTQSDPVTWKHNWQSLVPESCRDVPITLEGESVVAFIQCNQFVMMLQDGLLMQASFFDVCSFFQKAGYHVIWLMRCTQDVAHGYLKCVRTSPDGTSKWNWKSPTTNFGRWTSDNFNATILLQYRQLPQGDIRRCEERLLQRVIWAQSDDSTKMIPNRTQFITRDVPATPCELRRWLEGATLANLRK